MRIAIIYSLLCLALIGCGTRPEMIPDEVLKDMIEELMITDAVMSKVNVQSASDSVDYYRPVLDKYGYDIKDVEYTLRQLASRQSKPLTNIYDQIQADLNNIASVVKYNYSKREAMDNLAMLYYSDTLFRKNDTLRGKTGDLRAVILNPVKGKYHFTFMYQGMAEYNVPLREVVGVLSFKDKTRESVRQNSWVSRSFKPNMIRLVVTVPDSVSYDSLVFMINDPDYSKSKFSIKSDTSQSSNFRVFHIPDRNDARKAFFKHLTGMDLYASFSRDSLINNLLKTDSSLVWPLPVR